MNPFDQPRRFLEWPQAFELRIIHDAAQADSVRQGIAAIIQDLAVSRGPVQVLPSSKPRFGRLAAPVRVDSEATMDRLFQAVCAVPGVRYVV